MCGRFTLRYSAAAFAQQLGLFDFPAFEPRYNIAPTQSIAVIRNHDGHREAAELHWVDSLLGRRPSIGNRMINARAETVASKPSFRSAFKQRRCLILADGFNEWQKLGKAKQPYYFTLRDGGVFASSRACGNIGNATRSRSTRPRSLPPPRTTCCVRFTSACRSCYRPRVANGGSIPS